MRSSSLQGISYRILFFHHPLTLNTMLLMLTTFPLIKAVYNRAFSYDKLGQHEKALADYTRALQMQPNNSTAYHNRGNTLEKMGRLEAAMVDFSRAAELDTNSSASKHARALLLDKMGRHEEALTDFSAAITQEPLNALYYHNRGLCYRNLGDYTKVGDLAKIYIHRRILLHSNMMTMYRPSRTTIGPCSWMQHMLQHIIIGKTNLQKSS